MEKSVTFQIVFCLTVEFRFNPAFVFCLLFLDMFHILMPLFHILNALFFYNQLSFLSHKFYILFLLHFYSTLCYLWYAVPV